MVDLVIELILIGAILVPMIVTSLQPAKAVEETCSPAFRRFRRDR